MDNSTNKVEFNLRNDCFSKQFQSDFAKSLKSSVNQSLDLSNFLLQSDKPDDFLRLNNEKTAACADPTVNTNQTDEELREALKRDYQIICLRKEVQALLEENRRLESRAQINQQLPSNCIVENECLKIKIHTLEWQLQQSQQTTDMYHAMMEEVVRFLERVKELSKNSTPNNTPGSSPNHSRNGSVNNIASSTLTPSRLRINTSFSGSPMERSKSIHHVHRGHSPDGDFKMNLTLPHNSKKHDSPKKTPSKVSDHKLRELAWLQSKQLSIQSTPDIDLERLSEDAFRLLRTAQSVMSSRVADLTRSLNNTPTNSMPDDLNKSFSKPKPYLKYGDPNEMTLSSVFNSQINGRDSFSGQSSSSASTSSKIADENTRTRTPENKLKSSIILPTKSQLGNVVTENESGFSSMNSFQELPVNSIMIDRFNESNLINNSDDSTVKTHTLDYETQFSKNLHTNMSLHEVGLPIQTSTHRRYDSLPITYEKKDKFHINTDDLRVLWV